MNNHSNSNFYIQQLPSTTSVTTIETPKAVCDPNCSNKGSCISSNNCSCPTRLWTGNYCQIPVCNVTCENGGNCTSPGVCTCYYGWTGDYCQTVTTLLWTFDHTFNDSSGRFVGVGRNSPTYTSGINGYGSALSVNGSLHQCMIVTPYLNMNNISFTWQLWVHPTITPKDDSMFIGQCARRDIGKCLHLLTRHAKIYFGFLNDDAQGTTHIPANKWSHIAFVYDSTANKKSIYLNGICEISKDSIGPLQVGSANLTFGCQTENSQTTYHSFFTGYIDHVFYNSRIKNASEILDDATLVVHYRFHSSAPEMDSGPNYINGSWGSGGTLSTVSGIVGQALNISLNGSYFLVPGLVLLGNNNKSHSLSLWFKANSLRSNGTLVHVLSNRTGTKGCRQFMRLTSAGNITIRNLNSTDDLVYTGPVIAVGTWNHAVYTFSIANGMRLYVNGTLHGSLSIPYAVRGIANTLIFGNPCLELKCGSSSFNQQFDGSIDELRLYSRELNDSEVSQLYFNP